MTAPDQRVDVLIVGAGISGIGAAHHLMAEQPDKTFVVVEARDEIGGTWDHFRYPGLRSDSDLYTFGYDFKPWRDKESIATADRIMAYLRETTEERGIRDHIRFRTRVVAADWSSDTATWTATLESGAGTSTVEARWIFCASGYFKYDGGFVPAFDGVESFDGAVVHPQAWPEDLDYAGKRVVIIGSGATAITMLPAMAGEAGHVTMLQRTPTYVMSIPNHDVVAAALKKVLSPDRAHAAIRARYVAQQRLVWKLCEKYPGAMRTLIRRANVKALPDGYPVDVHFNPPYNPWEQRLCAAPDGDFFKAIRNGTASVVTDRIARFDRKGIVLASGERLDADVVVTATGFNLQVAGGIALSVDGRALTPAESVIYRGTLLSGVPNFAVAIGYTNSSWTLKIGLLCAYFVRLLAHLDDHGWDGVVPVAEPGMPTRPLIDFGAGYVQRALDELPRQGPAAPWLMSRDFMDDRRLLRSGPLLDDNVRFLKATAPLAAELRDEVMA